MTKHLPPLIPSIEPEFAALVQHSTFRPVGRHPHGLLGRFETEDGRNMGVALVSRAPGLLTLAAVEHSAGHVVAVLSEKAHAALGSGEQVRPAVWQTEAGPVRLVVKHHNRFCYLDAEPVEAK